MGRRRKSNPRGFFATRSPLTPLLEGDFVLETFDWFPVSTRGWNGERESCQLFVTLLNVVLQRGPLSKFERLPGYFLAVEPWKEGYYGDDHADECNNPSRYCQVVVRDPFSEAVCKAISLLR